MRFMIILNMVAMILITLLYKLFISNYRLLPDQIPDPL